MQEQYLYSFLVSLLVALAVIPLLIRYSSRIGLLDDPASSERKIHVRTVPRSGGLGIILASAVAALVVLPFDESLVSFVVACLVICSFGLLDDIFELSPLQKLGGQALCVIIAMAGGMVIPGIPFFDNCPVWICYPLTFIFVIGVINGINFLDGMDGLAAGTTIMAMALLFVLALESSNSTVAVVSLSVSAALLGFLRFNTHPARIFMGDAGSQFLGFVTAWLAITVSRGEDVQITSLMPLLVLGIPVLDILQVIPVRIAKGLPLPGPDREHFHHQIAKLGFHHYEVVAITYFLQAILLEGAYLLRHSSDEIVLVFYFVFCLVVLLTIYMALSTGWRIRPPAGVEGVDRRNHFFRRLSALHSYSNVFLGGLVACLFAIALMSGSLPVEWRFAVLAGAFCLIVLNIVPREVPQVYLGRIASYSAAILLIYGMSLSAAGHAFNLYFDALIAFLGMCLLLSIRITRKTYFGLTTEDLLVGLFFIALAPLVVAEFGRGVEIVRLVLRTAVLLYTCEYLLTRGPTTLRNLKWLSLGALLLIGMGV